MTVSAMTGKPKLMAPGGRGVFQVVYLAQGQDKGEDPVLVVHQDVASLAAFHPAKSQGGASGKAEGVDGTDGIGAKGHDVGIVPHLHPFFLELVDDGPPVDVAATGK
jgi:hypothetical protein